MFDKLLLFYSMHFTYFFEFGAVGEFLYDFHSFLADVEADVFGGNALGLQPLDWILFNNFRKYLDFVGEEVLGRGRSGLKVDKLRAFAERVGGHSLEGGNDRLFYAVGLIFFEEEAREHIEGVVLGRIEKLALFDERVKVEVCAHWGSS